ncbi:hypothetical protein SFRURICE_004658, partial [Spodoptera frugiperda]
IAVRLLKHVTKLYDLEWHLRDGEILAEDRGAVIISNHQSSLDILGMFNIWDVVDKLAAIAKKELFYIWPFGLSAYLAGVVFIDRSNAKGAYKQLKMTSEVMVKNKTKIWLFPEGTRNKDYTKLQPFKKGAFNIAVAAQVPIIPVVFSPYYFINKEKYIFNKGHVIIQCLEPVPTTGLTMDDVPDLINKIHEKMSIAYKELSKEVVSAFTKVQVHIHMTPDPNKQQQFVDHTDLLRAGIEPITRYMAVGCPATALTVQLSEFKKVRFYIKFYFYYVALSSVSFVIIPLLLIKPKHHTNGPFISRYMRDFVDFVYGWKWHIRNKEILMEDRGAVIISNHLSVFDSSGINHVWVVAKKVLLIAKKELLQTGPLGVAMYLCEGTRNTKWDGKLLPFKKGAFNLAVTAQVPIIPVVFSPYYFFDKDKYIFNKGHVILQCLEPVPTIGLTLDDVPALSNRLHQIISRTFEQLSKEVLFDSRDNYMFN